MRQLSTLFRRRLHQSRVLQIGVLSAFWYAGETVVRATGLPIPAGIVGMLLVLGLLGSGRISLFSVRRGADFFLAEMLLFFVPAVLAVLQHREFLGLLGLKVLAVIVFGILAVMSVTGLAVDTCYRWRLRHVPPHAAVE